MGIHYGADFSMSVRTATGPDVWTPVENLNRFGERSNRNVSTFSVFRRSTAYSIPGARETTYSVSGYLDDADVGQNFLRTAEADNTDVMIRVIPTEADDEGFDQMVRVGSSNYDVTPDGIQEWGFELAAVADKVPHGTPGILV